MDWNVKIINMDKKLFLIAIFIQVVTSCQKDTPLPTFEMINYATELAVNRMNENIDKDFELCGQFCSTWADSTLINAIRHENLKDIFSDKDYKYMIKQYYNLKDKNIDNYLHNIKGYTIENDQRKHLDAHICISPPLFSISKRSWVIFNAIFTRKGFDEFFVVYTINPKDNSILATLYSNDRLKPIKGKQHSHSYWLNFIKPHAH